MEELKVRLNVEWEYGGVFSPYIKEKRGDINFIWGNKLSEEQRQSVHKVILHLGEIIDLEKVQQWTVKNHAEVMIFGSRTRGHQRENSDLDVMILPEEKIEWEKVETFLDKNYHKFQTFLKKDIELDFKLNTSTSDQYAGFTYTGKSLPEEELDFIFDWYNIPSYLSVNRNRIAFQIVDKQLTFNGDVFAKRYYD